PSARSGGRRPGTKTSLWCGPSHSRACSTRTAAHSKRVRLRGMGDTVSEGAAYLQRLVDEGRMASDWAGALEPVAGELVRVQQFVASERDSGHTVLPAAERVLAAFQRPLAERRGRIRGRDPEPTLGRAIG